MKIANIVGARPQFIKYFPISMAINEYDSVYGNVIEDVLIHTGQHYDYEMSKLFFDEFGIKEPDYHLDVGSGTHGKQTGQIIERVEKVLVKENPNVVILFGDTNTTLGGAISASKLHIPVAHVEAGLRSFNKYMPEEINRILVDHTSTFLLCPSKTAITNLKNEGFDYIANHGNLISDYLRSKDFSDQCSNTDKNKPIVVNVGDVMFDLLIYAMKVAERKSEILNKLKLKSKEYFLLTLHRAENTDNPEKLAKVTKFVNEISKKKTVIFPMHPRTKQVCENSFVKFAENVGIIPPVGYFDIIKIMNNSLLIMTDSGGIQKEAYWLKIPCITLRGETEWTETIESGWNVLYENYNNEHKHLNVDGKYYGDGKASENVLSVLTTVFA